MRLAFIDAEKADSPVALMCRLLLVSRAGYYEWRMREPSKRSKDDTRLAVKIAAAHTRGRGTYGSRRIVLDLQAEGERVDGVGSRG